MKNAQYWIDKENRAKKARAHAEKMKRDYPDLIRDCVKRSVIYSPESLKTKTGVVPEIVISVVPKETSFKREPDSDPRIEISVVSKDSVSTAFAEKGNDNRVCILNFASYKEPGGMFLKGSKAQEECLCHESFLFNVLYRFDNYYEWNKKHLNQGLYLNRAIYSPDVMFEHNGKRAAIDVLTCAAPNYSAAFKYQGISKERNFEILRSRIAYVLSILEEQKPDVAILGAWGCGVFGQDPLEVAALFRELIRQQIHASMRIIFAVPDGRDGNYEAFRMVFHHPVFKNE